VLYTAVTEDFPPRLDRLNNALAAIAADATTRLTDSGIDVANHETTLSLEMSFRAQVYAIDVPLGTILNGRTVLNEDDLDPLLEKFFEEYEKTFGEGVAYRSGRVRVRGLRCVARGVIAKPEHSIRAVSERQPTVLATRPVFWAELGEELPTPAYDGTTMETGATILGPATIGFPETTVVVAPGQSASADEYGNIRLHILD
jgi:N-methylhydantoinase A